MKQLHQNLYTLLVVLAVMFGVGPAVADDVYLSNGDHFVGRLIRWTGSSLIFEPAGRDRMTLDPQAVTGLITTGPVRVSLKSGGTLTGSVIIPSRGTVIVQSPRSGDRALDFDEVAEIRTEATGRTDGTASREGSGGSGMGRAAPAEPSPMDGSDPVFQSPAPEITTKSDAIQAADLQRLWIRSADQGKISITFDVVNNGTRDIKDIEITCELTSEADPATHVFSKQTVAQTVRARRWRRFHRIDFEAAGPDVEVKSCLVTDLVLE